MWGELLSAFNAAAVNALITGLKATATGFVRAGTAAPIHSEITAFMRYVGQGWEIPVTLPDRNFTDADAEMLRSNFCENYARFFGRAIAGLDGLEIEIVTWSVKSQDQRAKPVQIALSLGGAQTQHKLSRPVFDPSRGVFVATAIITRSDLTPGARVQGPAIIVERETSTVVTTPFDVVMQSDGSLLLIRKGATA